jgi:hypothetical protein
VRSAVMPKSPGLAMTRWGLWVMLLAGWAGCACPQAAMRSEAGGTDESGLAPVEMVGVVDDGLETSGVIGQVEAVAPVGTVAVGGACGAGIGACDAMGVCRYAAEDVCGDGGGAGVCEAKPTACKRDCPGVCGCDGQRFCNACVAQARGFTVRHVGACAEATP